MNNHANPLYVCCVQRLYEAVYLLSRSTFYCYSLFWLKLRPQKSSKKILFAEVIRDRLDFVASSKKSLLAENTNIGCFRKNYCGAVSHLMAHFGFDRNSCTPIPPILEISSETGFADDFCSKKVANCGNHLKVELG